MTRLDRQGVVSRQHSCGWRPHSAKGIAFTSSPTVSHFLSFQVSKALGPQNQDPEATLSARLTARPGTCSRPAPCWCLQMGASGQMGRPWARAREAWIFGGSVTLNISHGHGLKKLKHTELRSENTPETMSHNRNSHKKGIAFIEHLLCARTLLHIVLSNLMTE